MIVTLCLAAKHTAGVIGIIIDDEHILLWNIFDIWLFYFIL